MSTRNFSIPTNRMEAFSDGVFAIVITLLAFQFKVPNFSTNANLLHNLDEMLHILPKLLAFIFSFAFISVFWINHHQLYHSLKEADNRLLWLNIHMLFWISMLPFPISMVGDYPRVAIAAMSLGVVLLMCSLAAFLVRRYAYFKGELADERLSTRSIRDGHLNNLIAIGLNLVAIIAAAFSVYIAYSIYVVVLALFIVPQKLEKKSRV